MNHRQQSVREAISRIRLSMAAGQGKTTFSPELRDLAGRIVKQTGNRDRLGRRIAGENEGPLCRAYKAFPT